MAVALTLWVGMTSCGGKLLPMEGPGSDASPAGDDASANGGGSSGVGGGSSSGLAGGSGGGFPGGSSSGFAGGSTGGLGGGSASSSGASGFLCTRTADCPRGQVCCGAFTTMSTACQLGPCPSSPIGPIQLCASATECPAPDTCGPIAIAPTIPVKICNAPSNPVVCTGCIDLNGACNMGGADTACGVNGATCQNCAAVGGACINGNCQTASIDAGGALGCMFGPCTNRCPAPYYTWCCRSNGACGCLSSNLTCQ